MKRLVSKLVLVGIGIGIGISARTLIQGGREQLIGVKLKQSLGHIENPKNKEQKNQEPRWERKPIVLYNTKGPINGNLYYRTGKIVKGYEEFILFNQDGSVDRISSYPKDGETKVKGDSKEIIFSVDNSNRGRLIELDDLGYEESKGDCERHKRFKINDNGRGIILEEIILGELLYTRVEDNSQIYKKFLEYQTTLSRAIKKERTRFGDRECDNLEQRR